MTPRQGSVSGQGWIDDLLLNSDHSIGFQRKRPPCVCGSLITAANLLLVLDRLATEPTPRRYSWYVQVTAQPALKGPPDFAKLDLLAVGHELCSCGDRICVDHGECPARCVHGHLLTQGRNLYGRA